MVGACAVVEPHVPVSRLTKMTVLRAMFLFFIYIYKPQLLFNNCTVRDSPPKILWFHEG